MFGLEILEYKYPDIKQEIEEVLTSTSIPHPTKPSKEKTKQSQLVYSGKDFNGSLNPIFAARKWTKRKVKYAEGAPFFVEVDHCKDRVGIELQLGKYSFVPHNFYKFQYLFARTDELRVDVGVEVVAIRALARRFYTGPASFESVVAAIQSHARNEPPVPLWLVGIDLR